MPKAPKNRKVVHPNSRRAAQLNRKEQREIRLDVKSKEKEMKLEVLREKLLWFQDRCSEKKVVYTKGEAQELVDSYLGRFDEELEQIDALNSLKGRSGQQHVPRKQVILATRQREHQEYDTVGMEIPDIMNGKALKIFRDWNGEMRFLQNIKMRRVKSAMGEPTSNKGDELEAEVECEDFCEQEARLLNVPHDFQIDISSAVSDSGETVGACSGK